ncbi:hypothetical protein GGF32_006057 [Allomyces javanicus]|nr:hypothetical protein GGF32_006057 [Allomyces javanicus]
MSKRRDCAASLIELAMRAVPAQSSTAVSLAPFARLLNRDYATVVHAEILRVQLHDPYPDDPIIDAFLRGNYTSVTIVRRFRGFNDACAFADQHGRSLQFSVEAGNYAVVGGWVVLMRTEPNVHGISEKERRDAHEMMRKLVKFCGDEVVVGMG